MRLALSLAFAMIALIDPTFEPPLDPVLADLTEDPADIVTEDELVLVFFGVTLRLSVLDEAGCVILKRSTWSYAYARSRMLNMFMYVLVLK